MWNKLDEDENLPIPWNYEDDSSHQTEEDDDGCQGNKSCPRIIGPPDVRFADHTYNVTSS